MSYLRLLWTFVRIGAMNELAYRANFWVQLLQSLCLKLLRQPNLYLYRNHPQSWNHRPKRLQ